MMHFKDIYKLKVIDMSVEQRKIIILFFHNHEYICITLIQFMFLRVLRLHTKICQAFNKKVGRITANL